MKRILSILCLLLLVTSANARPAPPCRPSDERLVLTPTGLTINGEVARAGENGRYGTDGGVEFYVSHGAQVEAVPEVGSIGCMAGAKRLTIRFTDPWTGDSRTMSLGETP